MAFLRVFSSVFLLGCLCMDSHLVQFRRYNIIIPIFRSRFYSKSKNNVIITDYSQSKMDKRPCGAYVISGSEDETLRQQLEELINEYQQLSIENAILDATIARTNERIKLLKAERKKLKRKCKQLVWKLFKQLLALQRMKKECQEGSEDTQKNDVEEESSTDVDDDDDSISNDDDEGFYCDSDTEDTDCDSDSEEDDQRAL